MKARIRNVGLGHAFLRHIERCKILVLLLDMAGTDNRAPWDDYQQLLKELELYDPALLEKPRLVVANKMDEAAAEKNLKQFKKKIRKVSVLPISAFARLCTPNPASSGIHASGASMRAKASGGYSMVT